MLPLKGIRVLDLSRILAGPYCSMLLGDMGADIIKIENTKNGDDTRQWGPPFVDEDALYFWSVNRNKRSVSVDFSTKNGRAVIEELTSKCDVLIENFIPNTLVKYGLDFNSLRKISPKLVYCSITGFGQKGPMAQRAGYDVIAAGIGGLLSITGPEDGPPCRVGVAVTDIMTGLLAQSSILTSLLSRTTNPDCGASHIDCNLLSTQISMLFHIGANYLTKNIESERIGTAHSVLVPYQAFLTEDSRYFIIGVGNEKQFTEMCALMNMPTLLQDHRFKTNPLRVSNRSALIPILEKQFCTRPLQYWVDLFNKSSLPNGPINNMADTFSNPQVKFLSDTLITSWPHTDGSTISVPGFPIRCSSWKSTTAASRPPMLGEHTKEVLSLLLKYSDTKIKELDDSGAIRVLK